MNNIHNIIVMTGAGISAPSGIQTFRGSDGLWNGYRVEEVATPDAFLRNPNLVHDFYNERRTAVRQAKPNAAHIALERLFYSEYDFKLITQNVDDLHERGGVEEVIHMHGELCSTRCVDCWNIEEFYGDTSVGDLCTKCQGKIRPNIVWFGESPFELARIDHYLKHADLYVSIGTSGMVAPACDFVLTAKQHGAHTIEFNLEKTEVSYRYDECIVGDVVDTVPQWVDGMINLLDNEDLD